MKTITQTADHSTSMSALIEQVASLLIFNGSLSASLVDKNTEIAILKAQLLNVTSVASALNHINRY